MKTNKISPQKEKNLRQKKEEKNNKKNKMDQQTKPESFAGEDQFAEMFQAHYQKLYSYLFFFVNNSAIAEELTQELFLRLYQYTQEKGEVSLSWLYSVARNLAIDWKRKNINRLEINLSPDHFHSIQDQSVSIVEKLELKESIEHLDKAILILDDREKEIFLLRVIEQMKYSDIAPLVNISERNIKRIMRTALQKVVHFLHENSK